MKTRVIGAALLLLAGTGSGDPLLACGEKFLMGSRGTRFQPSCAPIRGDPHLRESCAEPARALANVPFEATLRKAGYRPTVVTSAEALTARWPRADGISSWLMCPTAMQ